MHVSRWAHICEWLGPYLNAEFVVSIWGQDVTLSDPRLHVFRPRFELLPHPQQQHVVETVWGFHTRLNKVAVLALHNLTCLETMRGHLQLIPPVLVNVIMVALFIKIQCRRCAHCSQHRQLPEVSTFCGGFLQDPRHGVLKSSSRTLARFSGVVYDVLEATSDRGIEALVELSDPFHAVAKDN